MRSFRRVFAAVMAVCMAVGLTACGGQEEISSGVEDGVLTIAADINSEKKDNREGYLYSERRTGHVERRFSLEGVREDDITAKCEHGILTVTLPKMQAEAPKTARKIAIASGEEKTDAPAEENK